MDHRYQDVTPHQIGNRGHCSCETYYSDLIVPKSSITLQVEIRSLCEDKWQLGNPSSMQFSYTYSQYYDECIKFAKSVIAYKLPQHAAVNIIGFNAPEWCFAFYGSLFARCLPVGIYTTNSQQVCEYIAEHSEAKMILAENREYVKKYIPLLEAGKIDLIVFYNDRDYKPENYGDKIISYEAFIKEGERIDLKFVQQRIQKIKPGHCCTLVYTSGTTGMPKGVMLSHDNYTWTKKARD